MTTTGHLSGRQQGIALLTVLLVFALAAFIAADMTLTGISVNEHVALRQDARQAYYYALGAESYARELLWQDRSADRRTGTEVDGQHDVWPQGYTRFALDDGTIHVQITDLQSRFNLANLRSSDGSVDAAGLAQLRHLLRALRLDVLWADAIAQRLDSSGEQDAVGGHNADLSESSPEQQAVVAAPLGVSELVGVLDMTAEQYALLADYLTSLPEPTRLNINTATVPVMLAIIGDQYASGVRALYDRQSVAASSDLDEVIQQHQLGNTESLAQRLSTGSQWFEIDILAVYRQRVARLRSMVHRDPDSGLTRVFYRSPAGRVKAE